MSTERKSAYRVKPYSSLKAWRLAQGYSQREAAKFLGITQGFYSRLERKAGAPRKDILRQLTERTGVPADELMGIAS